MATISTIITSYNKFDKLKKAIDSIKAQTFKDWEVVIADNSTDTNIGNAIQLFCEELQKEDRRFIYLKTGLTQEQQNECTPYAKAINIGFKSTSGKYITYLCDDDWYLPGYYDRMLKTIEKFKCKIVYTGAFTLDDKDAVIHHTPAMLIRRCMFFTVDHNCVMHERSLFTEVGGWEERKEVRSWGDAEFWYKLAVAGYEAYPTGKITVVKVFNPKGLNATGHLPQGAKKNEQIKNSNNA